MPTFGVAVRAKLERFSDEQLKLILRGLPNADFDRVRRVIVHSVVVESDTEEAAHSKAQRIVRWVLDDAGLTFTEYTVESRSEPASD